MKSELQSQGFEDKRIWVERMLNMRFDGTDTAIMVLPDEGEKDQQGEEDFMGAFRRVYKQEFGFLLEEKGVIVDDIKVNSTFAQEMESLTEKNKGSRHWKDLRLAWPLRLRGSQNPQTNTHRPDACCFDL